MNGPGSLRLFASFQGWSLAHAGRDLLAGLTLAAITIPEQMATARLGGFEPQIGFYAFIGATIGFAALGASRVLTAGADSTITPIFAGTLAAIAATGATSLGAGAVTLALLVGVMLIIAGCLRLGWIANLLSTPIITGFLAGIAAHILVSQLPSVFGIAAPEGSLPERAMAIFHQLNTVNLFTTAIGVGVLLIILVCERIDMRIPGALVGLILATLAVVLLDLEAKGVPVLGILPGGLPQLVLPDLDNLRQLVPLALILTLIIMMQTSAVLHSFPGPGAQSRAHSADTNRDFIGIGAGNLLAGLGGAFPVDASPPRTAVVAEAGGTSQLGALFAAVIVLALALWGGALLASVPQAALAGVLLFVAQRIFRIGAMARIAREAPLEFVLVALTTIAIILLPIEAGVAIGIGLSLLHGVWMTTHTRPIELHRIPNTTVWWPAGNSESGETQAGVAVIAFQAPLLFSNSETFKTGMIAATTARRPPPRLVVLEASGIADIDYTAAQILIDVITHCKTAGIGFAIARLESVRAQSALERLGIQSVLGDDRLFHSVEEAVKALSPKG